MEFKFSRVTPKKICNHLEFILHRPRMFAADAIALEASIRTLLNFLTETSYFERQIQDAIWHIKDGRANIQSNEYGLSIARLRKQMQPWLPEDDLILLVANDYKKIFEDFIGTLRYNGQEIPDE